MLHAISAHRLRSLVHERRALVLDCRSFVAYNGAHIVDSVNVHCPSILRRRSGGRLPLRTIIPNSQVRRSLDNSDDPVVVLYGEREDQSTADFVAKALKTEADLRTVYYLEGGFQNFVRCCPELVVSPGGGAVPSTPSVPPQPSPSPGPAEILPHLLLGSARDAAVKEPLEALGVTALLNVTPSCAERFAGCFEYKSIPVRDVGCEDIASHFHDAIRFIEGVRRRRGRVLVHCQAGVSRSATICIAYLMATRRMRMDEAYQWVKRRRRTVSPNFSFMGQLLSFEGQIFASDTS